MIWSLPKHSYLKHGATERAKHKKHFCFFRKVPTISKFHHWFTAKEKCFSISPGDKWLGLESFWFTIIGSCYWYLAQGDKERSCKHIHVLQSRGARGSTGNWTNVQNFDRKESWKVYVMVIKISKRMDQIQLRSLGHSGIVISLKSCWSWRGNTLGREGAVIWALVWHCWPGYYLSQLPFFLLPKDTWHPKCPIQKSDSVFFTPVHGLLVCTAGSWHDVPSRIISAPMTDTSSSHFFRPW